MKLGSILKKEMEAFNTDPDRKVTENQNNNLVIIGNFQLQECCVKKKLLTSQKLGPEENKRRISDRKSFNEKKRLQIRKEVVWTQDHLILALRSKDSCVSIFYKNGQF